MVMVCTLTGILVWFVGRRLATYLHTFQQEEYDALRFAAWWFEKRAFDRWASLGLLIAIPFAFFQPAAGALAAIIWLFWRGRHEPDTSKNAKKPLVFTVRAQRIWILAQILAAPGLAYAAMLSAGSHPLAGLVLTVVLLQMAGMFLPLANGILLPAQLYKNQSYLREATAILRKMRPTVVSISGAFGKTSTKYFLAHILAGYRPTLTSPGSTNTPLGLARIIREQLQPHHAYFLAEMGAYKIGSIAGICELFPPDICATTAIGAAHFERFKSLDAVAKAEFEVIDAVRSRHNLAQPGLAVLSIDCIPEALWRAKVAEAPSMFRLVSTHKNFLRDGDFWIKAVHHTPQGLTLEIEHKKTVYKLVTPLFGATMAPNLATAFALATVLDVPPSHSIAALATVQPAPHRLHVRDNGHNILIDDSYNSNPDGFITALETLSLIARRDHDVSRRRVLVTPGMVELGTLHDAEHARVGTIAGQHADVALIVGPARIPSFVAAMRAANPGLLYIPCEHFAAAQTWIQTHSQRGDVILLENDLPDRYEARWRL